MCLFVFAIPSKPGTVSADDLAAASGLFVSEKGEPPHSLWLSAEGGCGCSMLTDSADFSDEFWAFEEAVLPAVATALEVLARRGGAFTFEAIWAGDATESEGEISLGALLDDVRANRIRNAHVYRVR